MGKRMGNPDYLCNIGRERSSLKKHSAATSDKVNTNSYEKVFRTHKQNKSVIDPEVQVQPTIKYVKDCDYRHAF